MWNLFFYVFSSFADKKKYEDEKMVQLFSQIKGNNLNANVERISSIFGIQRKFFLPNSMGMKYDIRIQSINKNKYTVKSFLI